MFCTHCGKKTNAGICFLCYRVKNGMRKDVYYDICHRISEAYPVKSKRKIIHTPRVVGHPFCKTSTCKAKRSSFREFKRISDRLKIPKSRKKNTLSKKDYKRIISKRCIFCGINNANGIDRKESNLGYTRSNTQPCCFQCNLMKKNINLQKFVQLVRRVSKHQKDPTRKKRARL